MRIKIAAGHEYDLVSNAEMSQHMHEIRGKFDMMVREQVRGIKVMRAPTLYGTATGTSLLLPVESNDETFCGPDSGFIWRILRVTVASSGTDTGAVSIYSSSDGQTAQRNLIDSTLNVGKAWYPSREFLFPGEQLAASIVSVSGNVYTVNMRVYSVPAEMMGKII